MPKYKHIPKTAGEARRRRFKVVAKKIDPATLASAQLSRGLMIKHDTKESEPLSWCGPCEPNGFRRCCYRDEQGTWTCHSVPCHFSLATE
jgi:hypothetical protein